MRHEARGVCGVLVPWLWGKLVFRIVDNLEEGRAVSEGEQDEREPDDCEEGEEEFHGLGWVRGLTRILNATQSGIDFVVDCFARRGGDGIIDIGSVRRFFEASAVRQLG